MAKKNKEKKNKKNKGVFNNRVSLFPRDEDAHEEELNEVRKTYSTLYYNKMLSDIIRRLENGVTTISNSEMDGIASLAELYVETNDFKLNTYIEQILIISKTFYEHTEVDIISDSLYDSLIGLYVKKNNNEEPLPIPLVLTEDGYFELKEEVEVPKKEEKSNLGVAKITSKFSTLANNLDKSYTIYEDEDVPVGVSADNNESIEKFLDRIIDRCNLSNKNNISVRISPKIDGISINAGVKNGKLHSVSTRGKGGTGLNIIALEGYDIGLPEEYLDKEFGMQFEAFISNDNLIKLNSTLDKPYINPRSAASGIINSAANPDKFDKSLLKYITLYPITTEGLEFKDYSMNKLSTLHDDQELLLEHLDPEVELLNDIITNCMRNTFEYGNKRKVLQKVEYFYKNIIEYSDKVAIDGLVITVLNTEIKNTMGRVNATNKFQIALKTVPENTIGRVKDVYLSNGKKGAKTHQVVLETPVKIDGVTYTEIPVLSPAIFDTLDLHEGDEVLISRVGDVIPSIAKPKHMKLKTGKKKLEINTTCNACGQEISIYAGKYACLNMECPDNKKGKLLVFIEEIGIEGIAENIVAKIYDSGITDPIELYEATPEQLSMVPNHDKFFKELHDKVSSLSIVRLLVALGMKGIGESKAQSIVNNTNIETFIGMDESEHTKILDDIKSAKSINKKAIDYCKEIVKHKHLIKYFYDKINTSKKYDDSLPVVGYSSLNKDSEIILTSIVEGRYNLTKAKTFDILVIQDKNTSTNKVEKAKKLNLPIYTIEEFKDYINHLDSTK